MKVKPLTNDAELATLAGYASDVPADQAIVEVGSWAGGSARWLCSGSVAGHRAHLTCIDIWVDWQDPPADQYPVTGEDAKAHFIAAVDWSITTALHGPSIEVAAMWVKPIGLLFIDANHSFEFTVADYQAWSPHIAPGGVIAFHDYMPESERTAEEWWAEGPTRAVDEVVIPSGLWEALGVVDWTWFGRRY